MEQTFFDIKEEWGYRQASCYPVTYKPRSDRRELKKIARWRPHNSGKPFEGKWAIDRTTRRKTGSRPRGVFTVEERFKQLAKSWKKETAMFSLVRDKIMNSNYLEIIGLGRTLKETMTKLILKDLEKKEEFWHYALKSITDNNPVPKGMVNNLSVVRNSWIKWGQEQHLI